MGHIISFAAESNDDHSRPVSSCASKYTVSSTQPPETPMSATGLGMPAKMSIVGVPVDFLMQTLAANSVEGMSDPVISPKPFTGNSGQDVEAWF